MDRAFIQRLADDLSDNSPTNFLFTRADAFDSFGVNNYARNNIFDEESARRLLGAEAGSRHESMRFFQKPLFSIGRADDPGFEDLHRPEVVGPHHKSPGDWMPGAKTVIAFFLPYERATVEANKSDPVEPAMEWLYTRVEGQQHLLALGAAVRDAFIAEGLRAVTPYTEDTYVMQVNKNPPPGTEHVPPYNTNWSERHVAMICGLGTFGLSTNFISKAGCAGRLVSVITDWDTGPDERDYDDWLGYCNRCSACIRRCPGRAYYVDRPGKDHSLCGAHIGKTCEKHSPRYGCGKCQSGLPCDYQPQRPKK